MQARTRWGGVWVAMSAAGTCACGEPSPPLLEQQVTGVVILAGPRAGATVELRAEPGDGPSLGATLADGQGRFTLHLAVEPGRYQLTATRGGDATALAAWLPPLDHGTQLDVRVDAYTTWAAALVGAASAGGDRAAVATGLDAVQSHLGFDPLRPAAGDWRAPFLEDAFDGLAVRAARSIGARPGALTPERLLAGLVEDARHDALMDGLGASGPIALAVSPGTYRLTAETLRAELALAVGDVLSAPEWAELEPRDVRELMKRLQCSPSHAFPSCRATPLRDPTPPSIEWLEPAEDTPLAGVVTVRVTARDAESGVESLSLSWAEPPVAAAPPLVDEEPAPDVLQTPLDTRGLVQATVVLELVAINRDGAEATVRRTFAVDNLPGGVLRGSVFKGPAIGVEVAALPVDAEAEPGAPLAVALTDADGRFELVLPEYTGPLLLRATGRADGTSQYRNEAVADEYLTWGTQARLETFVPAFEPQLPGRERTISPLTDLAVARAWARRGEFETLAEAWDEATARLGAHFGVAEPATLRPTDPDETAHMPPTDADRYLLALACLSRQARELAPSLRPEAPATFTPLDLVALYRADLASDGVFDGRDGTTRLDLPANAFRGELARACALWLDDSEANRTGMGVEGVAATLENEISADTSPLFDADQPTLPYDEVGPVIDAPVFSSVEGYAGPEGLRGPVLVTIDAHDAAGLGGIIVRLEPAAPGAVTLLDAPTPGHGVWLLDTLRAPDGPRRLIVEAFDSLGNSTELGQPLRIDNTAPQMNVRVHDLPVDPGDTIETSVAETPVSISVDEGAQVELSVDGVAQPRLAADPGTRAVTELIWHAEGPARLTARAVDSVGNAADFGAWTITWDATPPVLQVEPSEFVDERLLNHWPMPEDLNQAGLPRTTLDEAGLARDEGVEIQRQVHRWSGAGEPSNPVVLRLTGHDGWTPAEALRLEWRRAPGACFLLDDVQAPIRPLLTPAVSRPGAQGRFGLPLDAETFGFDPLALDGEAGTTHCLVVTLADRAGNQVTRNFTFRTLRVAPVLDVTAVDARNVRVPRLTDVDATNAARLLDIGALGPVGVAAYSARNPHPDLPLAVEFRLPPPRFVVHREAVEAWDGPFFSGFSPPPCWRDFGAGVDQPLTWAFLRPEGLEWRCEPMQPIPWVPVTVSADFVLGVGQAAYGPLAVQELRRGPRAVAVELSLGLVPGELPGRLPSMLDPRPVPALFDFGYATVVQGPGRIAGVELECARPPCDVWYEASRGERLTGVETLLDGSAWQVVSRYGRHVELVLDVAGPEDRQIEFDP